MRLLLDSGAFQLLFSAEEDSQETHQSFDVERAAHEDACAKENSTYAAGELDYKLQKQMAYQ